MEPAALFTLSSECKQNMASLHRFPQHTHSIMLPVVYLLVSQTPLLVKLLQLNSIANVAMSVLFTHSSQLLETSRDFSILFPVVFPT